MIWMLIPWMVIMKKREEDENKKRKQEMQEEYRLRAKLEEDLIKMQLDYDK